MRRSGCAGSRGKLNDSGYPAGQGGPEKTSRACLFRGLQLGERAVARSVSQLRVSGCAGGPKDLRGLARSRHRGLVRPERAARRRCVGPSIRKQIKTCALFIPIISKNTHDRIEGYFRLEWKLAVDRSHLMAPIKRFSCRSSSTIQEMTMSGCRSAFGRCNGRSLPGGVTTPAFVERIRRLLRDGWPLMRRAPRPRQLPLNGSPYLRARPCGMAGEE